MFTIAKILLPIDFSVRSTDAADAAAAVAGHFGSEITLFHVLVHGCPKAEAEQNLKDFRSNEWGHLGVKRILREGDPASTIVEYAALERIDLIMMPTHGYGPFRRLLLGSVTAKVLHDAKCPVWTAAHAPEASSDVAARPRHIACAVDLGTGSSSVLSWASRLSLEFGAPLSVIHVAAELDPRVEQYSLSPEWRGHIATEARAELARLLEIEEVSGEIHIRGGSIAAAVVDAAREAQADLLVIGRGSHDGITGRLPTNAYAIIREAPCPVLGV